MIRTALTAIAMLGLCLTAQSDDKNDTAAVPQENPAQQTAERILANGLTRAKKV